MTNSPEFLRASCHRKELYDGIQTVARAVPSRSSLPILTHIRISAGNGRLTLTGTDLELWIEYALPTALILTDGAATAPAKNFTELLGAMPDADVSLSVEDDRGSLHLKCNRANYTLNGLPASEYPLLPQVIDDTHFVMDRAVLRDAIKQTLFAVSSDETRVILTGVLLVYQGDVLKLVATDTHRLALRECLVKEGEGSASAIVPARAMGELQRIIGNEDGEVLVTLSGNQVQFQVHDKSGITTTLISRLIDGQFPNFERVIPKESTRTLVLQRDLFAAAVRRASVVARDSSNRIVLRTSDDGERLIITAQSGNVGDAYEEVEMARSGDEEPLQIAFNSRYLSDLLNNLDSEGLRFELTEPLRPGVIKPTGDPMYLCVLMPMQVV
jgi:DNA polymerase-3 subunit beta